MIDELVGAYEDKFATDLVRESVIVQKLKSFHKTEEHNGHHVEIEEFPHKQYNP